MTFHSRSDPTTAQTLADALVVAFWRAWVADLAGDGAERWRGFWDALDRALPREQAHALFGHMLCLTSAVAGAASGPAGQAPQDGGALNRDEQLFLAMLASVQRGQTYDALASVWRLVAPDVSADVFDAAQRLGRALARQGLFLSQPCLHDGIDDPFASRAFDSPSRAGLSL